MDNGVKSVYGPAPIILDAAQRAGACAHPPPDSSASNRDETMKRALTLLLALAAALTSAQAQDARAGAKKVAMCIGCHGIPGYQATFPMVYKVPKIAGQNAKYITAALTAYQKGDRRHPTMRAIAASLTPADIADVAAFYEALGKTEATAPVPAVLETPVPEALKAKVIACTACHGANFNTPTDGSIPRLAGQHVDYLYAALRAYQIGGDATDTRHPYIGRVNATMNGMARVLEDADLKQIAAYLGSLPGEVKTVAESRFR